MSEQEKLLADLECKGLLDEQSVAHLKLRLRKKLKVEADRQEKEMIVLQEEVGNLVLKMSL